MRKLLNIINKFIPKGKYIVFHSFTDVSDNSLAMYLYIKNNKTKMKDNFKLVWLIKDMKKVDIYIKLLKNYGVDLFDDTIFVKRMSIKGLFLFMRSKYIFCTHGINSFIRMTKKQTSINLWHGMPLKKIGYLDGKTEEKVFKSNFNIATSNIFKKIISNSFNSNKVIVSGQPRNDLLFLETKVEEQFKEFKNIVWMPTYRKSKVGDIRVDGDTNNLTKQLLCNENIYELNDILEKNKYKLIIKPHPMDSIDISKFGLKNIEVITNDDLENRGINLYTVLKQSEALITDYSSVYIDYMLLDKPIGFIIDDLNKYSSSRGFVFDNPIEYMPGEKIINKEEFNEFIKSVILRSDKYKELRDKVNCIFNEVNTAISCELVANEIGFLKE